MLVPAAAGREAGRRAGRQGDEDRDHADRRRARRREDVPRHSSARSRSAASSISWCGRATPTRCSPGRSRTPAASRSTPPTWARATTSSPSSAPAAPRRSTSSRPRATRPPRSSMPASRAPLDLARIPSYTDLSEGFRNLKVARKDSTVLRRAVGVRTEPADLRHAPRSPRRPIRGARCGTRSTAASCRSRTTSPRCTWWRSTSGWTIPNDPSKLYNLSDEDLAKVKAKMLELRPNVRKYWVTAGDMTQLFQSGEVVAGEGWPLMTNQLRQAKFPAGETIPKEGHHRLGRPLGAHQGRQEPRRRLRLARVHGAAVHPEAAVRRHRLHRGQPGGQELHEPPSRPRASATSPTTAPRSTSGSGARGARSTRRSGTR